MIQYVSRLISASFALCGFATALLAGQLAGQPPARVLLMALLAMFVCRIIGSFVGRAGVVAVREHVDAYKEAHPVPELESMLEPVPEEADLDTPIEAGELASSFETAPGEVIPQAA